ncbi:MAG TPA: hypothetical protein VGC79_18455, partial [Polyangiaceae bacterium]
MLAYPPVICSICSAPLTVHRVTHGYCEALACLTAVGVRRHEQGKAEERAAIQAVARSHRESMLQQHPALQSQGLAVLVVPGFNADAQPMQDERRETLRQHIRELIAGDAIATESPLVPPLDDVARALQPACAICRG